MSTIENAAAIRRLSDQFWNKGNDAVMEEVFAPDFVDRNPAPGTAGTRESFRQFALSLRSAFSDTLTTVDDLIAEGDKVAWRWTFGGTQTGTLFGIPATGKSISLSGITIDRFADRHIVERWSYTDTLGALQQLGVVPGGAPGNGEAVQQAHPHAPASGSGSSAGADANKALVHRYFDLLNEYDVDEVATLLAPGYRINFDSLPVLDAAGMAGFVRGFFAGFPDIQHEVLDQVAAGDRVATRIMVRGTNSGAFMGMPPTGREVAFGAINIIRIANGRFVQHWVISDGVGMMQQLGVMPATSPAAA